MLQFHANVEAWRDGAVQGCEGAWVRGARVLGCEGEGVLLGTGAGLRGCKGAGERVCEGVHGRTNLLWVGIHG